MAGMIAIVQVEKMVIQTHLSTMRRRLFYQRLELDVVNVSWPKENGLRLKIQS